MRCAALAIALLLAMAPVTVRAAQTATDFDGLAVCDEPSRIMSVIASEATRQPFAAQVEVARVMVTKGACEAGTDFLAGLRVARAAASRGDYGNHHARAYFNLYSFPPDLLAQWGRAAHIALTEQPRVPRYHFDRADATRFAWWDSLRSCPNGDFVIGDLRFC